MATVLRVKRRNDEDPLDALVIAGKRRKIEAGASSSDAACSTPLTAVLKFAGTFENQEDDIVEHIHRTLSKTQLEANYKQHVVNVANKARLNTRAESKANRYKVVNYNRSINSAKTQGDDEKIVTVIDVEDSISCAADNVPDSEKEIGYVYDVYYTQTEEDMHMDDELSIHPFEQELVLDPYRENGVPEENTESDDSNSESNWRNDYPDSDHSSNSVDDDDMREAVRRMKMDTESSDLSSDEEDFAYALNEADVEAFGYNYAKYKARVKEEIDDSEDSNKSEQSLNSEPSDDDCDGKTEED